MTDVRLSAEKHSDEQASLDRLMTAEEAAVALHVSKARFYELARRGKVPIVRLGRSMRVDRGALLQFIASGGTTS